jgi:hypothetical protein
MVYLVGPPGVGKSTAVAELISQLGLRRAEPEPLSRPSQHRLWGEPLVTPRGVRVGVALGKSTKARTMRMTAEQSSLFSGTDRLSMGVSPEAVHWVEHDELPELIIGEGSRLGTKKFLTAAARNCRLLVVHLTADDVELDARRKGRGTNQSTTFLKAMVTASAGAADTAASEGAAVLRLATTDLSPAKVAEAVSLLL